MKLTCSICANQWDYGGKKSNLAEIQCNHKHDQDSEYCKYIENCSLLKKGQSYRCGQRNPTLTNVDEEDLSEKDLMNLVDKSEKERKKEEAKKEIKKKTTKKIASKRDPKKSLYRLRKVAQRTIEFVLGFKEPVVKDELLEDIAEVYYEVLEEAGIQVPAIIDLVTLEISAFSIVGIAKMKQNTKKKKNEKEKKVKENV